ncbi:hypothetical protein PWP93_24465 [Paraburkholderia sp. A1RI-2L]|uniref:hypothetical protein n=1 Tax=Paraburkholderia sp. A1RI-2L TaxID=3028367 RepID=UPI003B7796FB
MSPRLILSWKAVRRAFCSSWVGRVRRGMMILWRLKGFELSDLRIDGRHQEFHWQRLPPGSTCAQSTQ